MSMEKKKDLNLAVPCNITIKVLKNLFPVHSLVHVGLLRDGSSLDCWLDWKVKQAVQIEGPSFESPVVHPEPGISPPVDNMHRMNAWLASATGIRTLHVANGIFAGNGLLPAAAIKTIAPHAAVQEWPDQSVITLDQLLAEQITVMPNWLFINTLSSGEVLAGAEEILRGVRVVWARVRLQALEGWQEETHIDWIDSLLRLRGFVLVAVEEGIHPALGQAVFVKEGVENINHRTKATWPNQEKLYSESCTHLVDDRESRQARLQPNAQALLLENNNLQRQQQLLQEELVRAQAQIELIKDLLLRDGGI